MSNHPPRSMLGPFAAALLLGLAGFSSPVWAQAAFHKCVSPKGKVTYQDAPCDKAPALQNQPASVSTVPSGGEAGASSPTMRQLDAAVKSAIAGNDLPRAKRLAVTTQHWDWIAQAEKEAPGLAANARVPGNPPAQASSSNDCRQARRSYELESGAPEEIEKKKQLMYAACGMQAPPASEAPAGQTVIVTPLHRRLHPPSVLPPRSVPPATRQPRTPEYPEGTPPASDAPRKDR